MRTNRLFGCLAAGAVVVASHTASAALSARSYIADGLIGHWDGLENVSYGASHASTATEWTDLSGNSPAIPVPAEAAFVSDGLTTTRAYGSIPSTSTAILAAMAATNYSVEVAYEMTADSSSASVFSRLVTLGNDDYWVGVSGGDSSLGFSPVHNKWGGGLTRAAKAEPDVTGQHSFSCAQDCESIWIRVDGTNAYSTGLSTAEEIQPLHHGFRFNKGWYDNTGLDGTYHSLRIYDRALSEDEKAINLAVDRVRYFGWDAETIDLPNGWRFNTEDGVRLETTYTATASEGGTVSVNGGTAGTAVDFWGEYNGETTLNLTAVPAAGYVFARWRGVKGYETVSSGEFVALGNVQAVFYRADAPKLSARSYIADGLIGLWDGVYNVSADGAHDPTATEWTDLSGKSPAIPVPTEAAFASDGLTTKRAYGSIPSTSTAILSAMAATNYSVEVAYEMTADSSSASVFSRLVTLGNDDYWVGVSGGDSRLGFSPVHDKWGGGLTRTAKAEPNVTGQHSFSCAQNGGSICIRADGTNVFSEVIGTAQAIQSLGHGFRFNRGWYEDVGLDGTYHSLRIYDRALSEDEKAINLSVDRVRFFGWDPEVIVLPSGWRFNTEDGIRLECQRIASVVDPALGSISVNGGEASSSATIWVDHDAPTRIQVSALPVAGYKFKKWTGNVDPKDAKVQSGEISVTGDVQAVFTKDAGRVLLVR